MEKEGRMLQHFTSYTRYRRKKKITSFFCWFMVSVKILWGLAYQGKKKFKKWDFVILHKLPIVHFFSSQKSLHIMLHVSPPPFPYSMGSGGGEEEERRRRGGGGRWLSFRKDSIQFRKTLLITRTFLHIYIIQYMQSHALLFSDREKKIYTSN